jgi:hypothetical protein
LIKDATRPLLPVQARPRLVFCGAGVVTADAEYR